MKKIITATLVLFCSGVLQAQTADNMMPHLLVKRDGKTIDIAEQKGKVVFLNFWALSCVPCKEEMPGISKMHDHFVNDTNVLVVEVDVDGDLARSTAYMNAYQLNLPVYTVGGQVPQTIFHGILPTTLVIDKRGRIILMREEGYEYGTPDFISLMEGLAK